MVEQLPPISIVVIGLNEGQRLTRCLESVIGSEYPRDKIDLIYVDSDSTDDSCLHASRLGARVIKLRSDHPCAALSRKIGTAVAAHRLIHFVDGDTVLHRRWLKSAVEAIHDPAVACVFGQLEEIAPGASIYNFWAHHDWYRSPGIAEFCGGNALFRREALEQTGGFDERLVAGEEPDLCFRIRELLGMTILCLDARMALHDIQMTRFQQYWRRCVKTGYGKAEVGVRYHGLAWWRPQRWREPVHVLAAVSGVSLSLAFWSAIPMELWLMALAMNIVRVSLRLRHRFLSPGEAILYVIHQHISTLPITVGMCRYWTGRGSN